MHSRIGGRDRVRRHPPDPAVPQLYEGGAHHGDDRHEIKGDNPDPGHIRNILERHWEIEDPTGVDYKDIEITKDDSGVVMHVAYDDSSPYVANVSLMVHFDKTVKVQ